MSRKEWEQVYASTPGGGWPARYLLGGNVTGPNLWIVPGKRLVRVELSCSRGIIVARLLKRRSKAQQLREILEWADSQLFSDVELLARATRG